MADKNLKLAALGGEPACPVTWPEWPVWDENDVASVTSRLNSGGWGICPEPNAVSEFAARFAELHGAEYALCCANGTVALMIALRAAGVLPGDEVIMPAYTFMATATAAIGIGATPVVVDVDPLTLNIDPEKIGEAVTDRTRAVLPVHIAGLPADMDGVNRAAERYGLSVVEDCAQAHLAGYGGRKVGTLGTLGTFSFQSSKNLNAGEGGLVTTNDSEAYKVAYAFHHCGRNPDGGGWYEHPYMGQNLRLSQLQAALLLTQLDRLEAQHELRMRNGRRLAGRLSAVDGIRVAGWPWPEKVTSAAYHLFIFFIDPERFAGVDNKVFCEALRAEGVFCHGGYDRVVQHQDFFDDPFVQRMLGSERPDYRNVESPVAQRAVQTCVWIKQNQLLAEEEVMDRMADAVQKIRDCADDLPCITL